MLLCVSECPRAEVFCRMLPAVSSVHHELYHHTSNFPECKQKDTLPTLLLCLKDTPTDAIATPTNPTDTPIILSWTDAIDISSPGTQVHNTQHTTHTALLKHTVTRECHVFIRLFSCRGLAVCTLMCFTRVAPSH